MTLKDLKDRELALLKTHRDSLEEYGRAYAVIRQMSDDWAGPWLSDSVLIAEMADQYIAKEKKLYDLTKKEDCRLRIKAATELTKKSYVSYKIVFNEIAKYKRAMSFEEARELLQTTSFYEDIRPATLVEVLNEIHNSAAK